MRGGGVVSVVVVWCRCSGGGVVSVVVGEGRAPDPDLVADRTHCRQILPGGVLQGNGRVLFSPRRPRPRPRRISSAAPVPHVHVPVIASLNSPLT